MQTIQVDNHAAIVIDNWYSQEEYNYVFNECKFMSCYLNDPNKSGTARHEGVSLKKNKALFVPDLFRNFNDSFIGRYSYKTYQPEFIETLSQVDPLYYYLEASNIHNCLVSYYEESDYYKSHKDYAVITMVTWLYEEPKAFQGGNLILRDKDNNVVAEIECIANRSVIFPSFINHEVTSITMDKEDMNKNKGRFTVSQFSNITLPSFVS